MKKSELKQIIKEELVKVVNKNSTINEEFDNRKNEFSTIFLQTFYDMNNKEITFDEATDKLFAWIEANFK